MGQEEKAAVDAAGGKVGDRLLAERAGEEQAPYLAAFGVEIEIAELQILHFDLTQLTDAGTGGGEKTHDEIPEIIFILFEPPLEAVVILLRDYRVEVGAFLLPDGTQTVVSVRSDAE